MLDFILMSEHNCAMTRQDLHKKTLQLLLDDNRSYGEIAKKIEVSESWLKKFARDKYEDPGVNRIQTLHNFLSAYVAD